MTKARYGVLYYSVSEDGLHWRQVNGGRPVSEDYHGHASIARGADGRYFLVGNKSDEDPYIRFWVSDDLIRWTPWGTYRPDLSNIPGHAGALQRIGAPKLFFDRRSGKFLLTWHTPNVPGDPKDPERYWASQRTLYVQSRDLKTFEGPRGGCSAGTWRRSTRSSSPTMPGRAIARSSRTSAIPRTTGPRARRSG
ncbi:hypothetical protein PIB19_01295 [Sphingomonas sp. 7/4-4]|uniref:hypothetical protein n=1 Tax=Sphingomonas sp. 7/4-4 TaxID=3018446 RepID=UPI0022F3D5CE|nr:hypothetical protein [Sphingomonas sp. 7/4-4]WBY08221.1 hypothetical protein PIB19_01295 [Sphingomonas sp. 7/4-4]